MQIRVYVNDIFPADMEVDEKTGKILGGPVATDHWLNHDKMLWLFHMVAHIKAFGFQMFGHDPMFVCRISRDSKAQLRALGIEELLPYEGE